MAKGVMFGRRNKVSNCHGKLECIALVHPTYTEEDCVDRSPPEMLDIGMSFAKCQQCLGLRNLGLAQSCCPHGMLGTASC